jgi:uncharacterized protein YqiB (DUF1249 family)
MIKSHAKRSAQSSGRFTYLMGLYAENYWRLIQTFAPHQLKMGSYISSIHDQLDVRVELIQTHRYTLELRLSYLFTDPISGYPDPSANVRLYRDAQMAEVIACYASTRLSDVLGLAPEPHDLWAHRLRMNSFFNKWLDYLSQRGHSRFTLQREDVAQPSLSNL